MRSEHSRVAFAALDKVIRNHYMKSMRQETGMTFSEAADLMKSFSSDGKNLLDGMEHVDMIMRDIARGDEWEDALTDIEKRAFRIVCREMRKMFG
jgi:hypothetical protein